MFPLWCFIIVFVLGVLLAGGCLWFYIAPLQKRSQKLTANEKGRQSLIQLAQVAGGLAHEIKNPLSTINMNLRLLVEDMEHHRDDEHRRWLRRLESVKEEADRLRSILDEFLRFAGKVELQSEKVDLRKLVDELIDFFSAQADACHIVMRSSLCDNPVICDIDQKLIKQALLNLMINAVQAMGKCGELIISVTTRKGKALIEVTDTGPGIPKEELGNIFRAYYSTKSGGSGLGLPTTHRIILEHGGDLQVESEPGKGTRFTIVLDTCE